MPVSRTVKQAIDIEKLLIWAYRDELAKRYTSCAEDIWNRIGDIGTLGVVEPHHGGGQQRYDFGVPDPDAETIERAVGALGHIVIDWDASRDALMGHLSGLLASRDALLLGSIHTAALVTMHANMSTRPDWRSEHPVPYFIPPAKGDPNRPSIVGECIRKGVYSAGSYCPLKWDPSPISIALARADYTAWHRGLCTLAETLALQRFEALPPAAKAQPWFGDEPPQRIWLVGEHRHTKPLPLKEQRKVAGPRKATPRMPVRKIPIDNRAKAGQPSEAYQKVVPR